MSRGMWLSSFQAGDAADKPTEYPGDADMAIYFAEDEGTVYVAKKPASGATATWRSASAGGSVVVPDGTAYTVKAENSGRTHIVPDLTGDCTFTLPPAEDGLHFEFVYGGVVADAQDWLIDTGSNTNYYLGGLLYVDDAPAADSKAGDGNSNSIVTILTPEPGTRVVLDCDGTNWYLSGVVASASAPTFADQA